LSAPILVTVVAVLCAAAGVWLTSLHSVSRLLVPFSGGVFIGVAAFWVLPEMAEFLKFPAAVSWLVFGFALLWFVDRYVHPVCPSCSHTHDHDHCATTLHGFATPLLLAVGLHAVLDGWSISASTDGNMHLNEAFGLAIAIHKIPEGLALGVIVRSALSSRGAALAWCVIAQAATLVGAILETTLAPHMSAYFLHALMALAGGAFLYLGGHAIHGEWRRRGTGAAFFPALTGIAGPSVLRLLHMLS
jgi:zinc transporter ZupT